MAFRIQKSSQTTYGFANFFQRLAVDRILRYGDSLTDTKIPQSTQVNCGIGCGNLPLAYPKGFEPSAFRVGD